QYASLMIAETDLDAPGPLPARLTETMDEILRLQPYQPDALFISGLARAKAGDVAGTRALWNRALGELPQGAPLRGEIERRMNELE
ncbi:MAG: hypothetical protein RLN70_00705, partial [Rhodospirillaceae bacterium]